jgi:hypothetical protein
VNLHLAFLSLLLVTPLLGEAVLRAGIGMGLETFRRPDLYADYFSDDAYYQLRLRWQPNRADTVAGRFHPLLGWAPPAGPDNPLGLVDDAPPRPGPGDPVVLFYGDSFVAGASPPSALAHSAARIPQAVGSLLGEHAVLNLGVGGYGLGQIYLRFRETHRSFEAPIIVIGVLTTDLDRTVLTFRTGPKPWFELAGGELQLRGAPMEEESASWQGRFEPRIRSYLGAALFRLADRLTRPPGPAESRYRRAEKQAVNKAILGRMVGECRDRGIEPLFVIFSASMATGETGWREELLSRHLDQLQVPRLDTGPLLREEARKRGTDISAFILDDGHLNPEGNAVVAAAVAGLLARHQRVPLRTATQADEPIPGPVAMD